ncbi:MAG TPA: hypothetical protein VLA43_16870 [Longimicrobiales bacterium]|nr:hypothetical protein [Longimicrobiales bacterium]
MALLTRPTFSRNEEAALRRCWRDTGEAACPRCGVPLEARSIPSPTAVSYVRRRSWLACPRCHRAVIADDPRDGG